MGWVELIADDIASLLGYDEKGNLTSSRDDMIEVSFILYQLIYILVYGIILKRYEIHVNWLKLMTIPFLHTSSTLKADDSLFKANTVPWIGTRVIITKVGNPFKGYMGVVKDVLRGQDTASGLKIALQLEHVEFSSAFKRIVVDYDSVVEKLSVKDLHLQDSESESILNYPFFKDWIFTFGLGNKQTLILLAVINNVDGAADTLTGEQLELSPDSLCIAVETNEDKKLNANLMNSL